MPVASDRASLDRRAAARNPLLQFDTRRVVLALHAASLRIVRERFLRLSTAVWPCVSLYLLTVVVPATAERRDGTRSVSSPEPFIVDSELCEQKAAVAARAVFDFIALNTMPVWSAAAFFRQCIRTDCETDRARNGH